MQQKLSIWYHYQMAQLKSGYQSHAWLRFSQKKKMAKILKHVTSKIPFYQEYAQVSFNQLPVIDKSVIQDNFDKMNAFGMSYAHARRLANRWPTILSAHQSVGTSGKPGVYLFSAHEAIASSTSVLNDMLLATWFNRQKVAFFYLNKPYFPILNQFYFLKSKFFDLNEDFEKHLVNVLSFEPDVIVAPVQTLRILATLLREGKIFLKPKKIITTAEVLTALDESYIATAFKQNVHQLYQCAEGWLGTTCEYGTLHINEDQYFIEKEWIDNERFVPVITALNRYIQPLVRYRMEDILVLKAKPCACGSAMLAVEKISGRCEDTLYFSSKDQSLKPIYADNIHQALSSVCGNVHKYQLIQHSAHRLVVKIQADNFLQAMQGIEQQFEKLFSLHHLKRPLLEFVPMEELSLNQAFRKIQRVSPSG